MIAGEKTEGPMTGEPAAAEPEELAEVAELNKPGGTAEAGTTMPAGEDVFSEEVVVIVDVFAGNKAASMPLVWIREPEESGLSSRRFLGGPREAGR